MTCNIMQGKYNFILASFDEKVISYIHSLERLRYRICHGMYNLTVKSPGIDATEVPHFSKVHVISIVLLPL